MLALRDVAMRAALHGTDNTSATDQQQQQQQQQQQSLPGVRLRRVVPVFLGDSWTDTVATTSIAAAFRAVSAASADKPERKVHQHDKQQQQQQPGEYVSTPTEMLRKIAQQLPDVASAKTMQAVDHYFTSVLGLAAPKHRTVRDVVLELFDIDAVAAFDDEDRMLNATGGARDKQQGVQRLLLGRHADAIRKVAAVAAKEAAWQASDKGAGGKDEDNDVLAWLSSKGVLTPDIEGAFASFAISTKQDLAIMLEDGYLTMQTLLQAGVPMAPAAKLLRALKDWKS